MANPNPFGAFAEGLTGGIDSAQRMTRNYEVNQALSEERAGRKQYKEFAGELSGIPAADITAPPLQGPVQPGESPLTSSKPASAQLDALEARAMGMTNAEQREAALTQVSNLRFRSASLMLSQAYQTKDPRAEAAALNKAADIAGLGEGYFSVDESGKVVSPDGEVNDDTYAFLKHYALDPEKGMLWMQQSRMEERKQTDVESRTKTAADAAAALQAHYERSDANAEEDSAIRKDYYKAVTEHYERSDATGLLAELNKINAGSGVPGMTSADVGRVDSMMETAINKGAYGALSAADPNGFGGLAKAVALRNGVHAGNMSSDDATKYAATLYWAMNNESLTDAQRIALTDQFGKDYVPTGFNMDPVTEGGKPTGNMLVTIDTGEHFFVPTPYVQPYLWQQEREERIRNQSAAATTASQLERSHAPLPPPSPVRQANPSPLSRGAGGAAISPGEALGGMADKFVEQFGIPEDRRVRNPMGID